MSAEILSLKRLRESLRIKKARARLTKTRASLHFIDNSWFEIMNSVGDQYRSSYSKTCDRFEKERAPWFGIAKRGPGIERHERYFAWIPGQ